jgi:mono/diheme cytochrome c family protein
MKLTGLTAVLLLAARSLCAAEPVDYATQIKPVLRARCFSCHAALKQESGLRLDTGRLILKGGESGAAVVVGKPGDSRLVERISDPDEASRMPPEGKPLTAEQIALIRKWIAAGAVSPEDEKPERDPREHWAFKKPRRDMPQQTRENPWVRNPIDAFIAARQGEIGAKPLPVAKKHLLLRRVYLDLIGLPPSREQLHAFLKDDSPDAYEKVVDKLLASRHYGERWGRHWMDVWRYSDWYGRRNVNDVRNSYPHIWRWRDWIVNSLNEDKGYDQMIREMLAADELYPEDDERMPALGFIVRNWFSLNYDTWKQDLVEHTGKAFLGLRLNCAHCHDHKYDPISQQEYFQFRAFFEPLEFRHDRVPGGPALTRYIRYTPSGSGSLKPIAAGLPRIYDFYPDEKTWMYRLGDTRDRLDRDPVKTAGLAILGGDSLKIETVQLPPVAWYPGLKEFAKKAERRVADEAYSLAKTNLAAAKAALDKTKSKLANAEEKLVTATKAARASDKPASIERDPKNVIAHWKFEGNDDFLKDSSGNGHSLRRVIGADPPAKSTVLATTGAVRRFALPGAPGNKHAAEFQQPASFSYLAADGSEEFFTSDFSFECLLHCDVSQRNFNRTIIDYPGSWMLLHRGLDAKQFELRVRYVSEAGQVRDVCTSRQANPEIPPVETDSPPLILQTGHDYYVCLVIAAETVSFRVADLTAKTPLQFFEFARSPKPAAGQTAVDFSKLFRPEAKTPLNLGNSDGTGRFDGLLDEVRYSRVPLSIEQIAATVGQPANDAVRVAAVEVTSRQQQHEEHTKAFSTAEAELTAAEKQIASVAARLEAEEARYVREASDEEVATRTRAAAVAEHEAALAGARARLAKAELTLLQQANAVKPDGGATKTASSNINTEKANIAKRTKMGVPDGATYSPFGPQYPKTSTGRRAALARWIASPDNPLTARVAVNHIWMRHFGRPLVESVFDFGRGGKEPSHPRLLDWLAVELMKPSFGLSAGNREASPWQMKHLHRLIVTSNTYRLSSRPGADHEDGRLDPDNASYWKFQQRRLEAEIIRDSMLSVSGQLDETLGGQDIDPQLEVTSKRRSLYFSVYPEGGGMMPFLTLFDAPDPCDCYRRSESLVPQQALGMSNSVLALNLGRSLTKKLSEADADASDADFIVAAYETILSREPTTEESTTCRKFLTRQHQLFESPDSRPPPNAAAPLVPASTDTRLRAREGLIRVLLNHHEFVTIH